ncbi:MAG: ABC transporter permease [Chloroflexota bacterium]
MNQQTAMNQVKQYLREYGILLAFALIFISLSVLSPAFMTTRNILNVLDQSAQVGLVALGATMTIIGGGFDLSTGAIFALAGTTAAYVANLGYPILGLFVGVFIGLILGVINGSLIATLNLNSFVTTLASGLIFRGGAFIVTAGLLIQVDSELFEFLGRGRFLGAKIPVYVFLALTLIFALFLSRSILGRYIFALGGNEEAARLSGIRTNRIRILTFALSGFCAGLAGVIAASRISTGQANIGNGIELSAIAAVVIGGTSILGGEGAVWRTFVGVVLLQMISNGFNILNVPPFYQLVFQGGIIMFAITLDALRHRG